MVFERIRNLREDNDLTQKEIAAYLNCSQVAYSYYELGRRDVPVSVIIQLAKFYHCSTDYILGLSDNKK
ncbi:MAG: helix-turn-helix domain-containing protein [Blautia sp.]|nr:helix-turn-helix domain-containing protein [Blautia sp.]